MALNIQSFTPIVHFDHEADVYIIFCEEYPEIIVTGNTEEHSHSRLTLVIEQFCNEEMHHINRTHRDKKIA